MAGGHWCFLPTAVLAPGKGISYLLEPMGNCQGQRMLLPQAPPAGHQCVEREGWKKIFKTRYHALACTKSENIVYLRILVNREFCFMKHTHTHTHTHLCMQGYPSLLLELLDKCILQFIRIKQVAAMVCLYAQ